MPQFIYIWIDKRGRIGKKGSSNIKKHAPLKVQTDGFSNAKRGFREEFVKETPFESALSSLSLCQSVSRLMFLRLSSKN